jgi:hypothetical protein
MYQSVSLIELRNLFSTANMINCSSDDDYLDMPELEINTGHEYSVPNLVELCIDRLYKFSSLKLINSSKFQTLPLNLFEEMQTFRLHKLHEELQAKTMLIASQIDLYAHEYRLRYVYRQPYIKELWPINTYVVTLNNKDQIAQGAPKQWFIDIQSQTKN